MLISSTASLEPLPTGLTPKATTLLQCLLHVSRMYVSRESLLVLGFISTVIAVEAPELVGAVAVPPVVVVQVRLALVALAALSAPEAHVHVPGLNVAGQTVLAYVLVVAVLTPQEPPGLFLLPFVADYRVSLETAPHREVLTAPLALVKVQVPGKMLGVDVPGDLSLVLRLVVAVIAEESHLRGFVCSGQGAAVLQVFYQVRLPLVDLVTPETPDFRIGNRGLVLGPDVAAQALLVVRHEVAVGAVERPLDHSETASLLVLLKVHLRT